MVLRPAQQKILEYRGGRLAISAVPGSGKTFTLSMLACELLRHGLVNVADGQQILVVTYLNSSVETFRARIRSRLEQYNLPLAGYDVRTLHSLALEIVRLVTGGGQGLETGVIVMDEAQSQAILARAVDAWIEGNQQLWNDLLAEDEPHIRARWRRLIESTARSFIREAKNYRYAPEAIWQQLRIPDTHDGQVHSNVAGEELIDPGNAFDEIGLLYVMTGIYERYQSILRRQGAADFDDLIWQAAESLVTRSDVATEFSRRWPFVLEDESQDSVPLQEMLLARLTDSTGNWVRVGDPNQAITSTFTSAHPRHFNAFMQKPEVMTLPLPNSGRCAPIIFGAANRLVSWVCDDHPVPEVRRNAFRPQQILPAPPGDAQPNPPDTEAEFLIKVFGHREEEEIPAISQLAAQYAAKNPHHTVAILTPTNVFGHSIADRLDALGASYDNLLRGGARLQKVASILHWLLRLMAYPLEKRALDEVYGALVDLQHPAVDVDSPVDRERMGVLLRSVYHPELLLYGSTDEIRSAAVPPGVTSGAELQSILRFADYVRHLFQYRPLVIDDMILSLSDELFAARAHSAQNGRQAYLAIAYQLAAVVRVWWETQSDWRLPELAEQLFDVAEGRRHLHSVTSGAIGFEPEPGRITLATQHGAKGMEWDAVFLTGIDAHWVPGDLEGHFLGVEAMIEADPAAEVSAQLHYLMGSKGGLHPGRAPTESAHIEIICERLRLLYVGITRARRYLHISRSRRASGYQNDYVTEPSTAMAVLYQYLKSYPVQN